MSLTKEALEHLESILTSSEATKSVMFETDKTVVPLPGNVCLQDLEIYLPNRRRFRGAMQTHLIEQYGEYVNANAEHHGVVQCFIDAESMTAKTIFDLGDAVEPGHCEHTARIKLTKTQPFVELESKNGSQLRQKALAEWIEDWRDFLTIADSEGKDLSIASAISAIRRVTVSAKVDSTSEEQNFGSRKSTMAQVEAANKDVMPAFITFTTAPFHGLSERHFTLRVSLLTGDENPKFTLRIVRLEETLEKVAEEFRERLEAVLNQEAVTTFVGVFSS
jgi:uncharacterized protein YfdQ (DUF2303 family)